ncbi:MAG: ABC transporter ATP-binding protein [Planctomycetes bacterium]|nr:ABC transporter ATP-binding protein [Planctomycetota bacterium]
MSETFDKTVAPAVDIRGLWFAYDGRMVLKDVTMRIEPLEFVCVVGPNGGGKTTLLKLMLGLLRPTRGLVRIFGRPAAQARRRMGYVPQHAVFDERFPVSVLDVVLMGRLGGGRTVGPYSAGDRAAAWRAIEEVGLASYGGRQFSELSGGQRQRAMIARALAGEPEMLLLDEPTANLDIGMEREFHELLGRLNERMTIVLVSHDIAFVTRRAGKVFCVQGGVQMHPTTALTGEMMRALYAQDIRLVRHDHDYLARGRPAGPAEPRQ